MNVEADDVVNRLARQVAELTVRLAIAEARVGAYERAEVERAAAEEAANDER